MKTPTEETLLNGVSIAFIVISTFVLLPLRHGIDGRFAIVLVFLFAGVLLILRSSSVNFGLLDSFLAKMRASVTSRVLPDKQRALASLLIYSFAFLILVFRIWRMGASVEFDEPPHLDLTKSMATFDFESWVKIRSLNPPLPYILMGILLRPFDFSLLAGRVISCLWAAIIPVVLFYTLHELSGETTMAISVSFAYTLSTLYQGAMFKYDFDALSTLFFSLCVYGFVLWARRKERWYFGYSMIAWILVILTKHPPAGWLFIGFIMTGLFHKEVRSQLRFILLALSIALLTVVALAPAHPISLLSWALQYFAWWLSLGMEHAVPVFRDLAVIVGWSPYLAFTFKLGDVKKTQDLISMFSVFLIVLAFINLILDPLTRRVIQVIPLLAVTLFHFSTRRWSRTTSLLMLMNFCWWGLIKLPYL